MTVAISRKLEQRAVKRTYYVGDVIPDPRTLVADIRRRVDKVRGFDLVDVAGMWDIDEMGIRCFRYVALFQRDGTTLEAQAASAADKAAGIAPDGKPFDREE